MVTSPFRHVAFALSVAISGVVAAAEPEATSNMNAPVVSVVRQETDVFASNKAGVFRANLESRQWRKLDLPAGMPLGGRFAKVPNESAMVLYVASNSFGRSAAEGKYGVYASSDAGETWSLLSENDDYGSVLLLPNGSLFAVTNPLNLNGPSHVHLSKDMGKTWRDITGKSFGSVFDLFPDPDHPNQVCLRVSSTRGYILQAGDERYLWNATRDWEWHPERFRTTEFFQRGYSTQTTLYMLAATLNNYFQYDFGDRTAIPSFELSSDESRIAVAPGREVVVPITIRFREDDAYRGWLWEERRATGFRNPEPTPTTVTLIDSPSSYALWGIRVEFQGQRTAKRARASDDIYRAQDRDAVRQRLLSETNWNEIPLTSSLPYRRQLDLTRLHDFAAKGTYRVQLTYDNSWLADRDTGHWVGTFSSPVFEVIVGESKQ